MSAAVFPSVQYLSMLSAGVGAMPACETSTPGRIEYPYCTAALCARMLQTSGWCSVCGASLAGSALTQSSHFQ